MSRSTPSIVLLIPAYNEEHRIEPVLRDYARFFHASYAGQFQIIVVLNGCIDNTLGIVQRVAAEYPEIKFLEFKDAIGKGGALIEGLRQAPDTDLVGYVDADGATGPKAFLELVKLWDQADCIIGSRWLPGAVLHQSQTSRRQLASRVFHLIVQMLFWMNIRDTQCGAKVMRRSAIARIHPALRIADMAFDINLLYVLKREGFRVLEVPTEWTDKIGSKVALGKTSLSMLLSVIRLRLVYSPIYPWLGPLRPLEAWLYKKLRAPYLQPTTTQQHPSQKLKEDAPLDRLTPPGEPKQPAGDTLVKKNRVS